mmetsp:Transcript_24764/g.41350  ORF Transcript_24764/g.41350 Transcript_24764/m.41350 type:complete len:84 (+) Transcript_24764:157-408(+)
MTFFVKKSFAGLIPTDFSSHTFVVAFLAFSITRGRKSQAEVGMACMTRWPRFHFFYGVFFVLWQLKWVYQFVVLLHGFFDVDQ